MRMTLLLLGLTCNENDFIAARTNTFSAVSDC